MNSSRLLLLPLFFCCLLGRSQDIPGASLLPFVENFVKSEYNGDNQVWSITQGGDNAMYVANNHYFLRYNGVKWERYTLPNRSIIRSVMADGDKVYTGSYNDFGYWKRIKGQMVYSSLAENAKCFGANDNEEIWKIFKLGNTIYFQSFNEIFILSADGKIEKKRFPHQISYCYVVGDKVYAATVRHGVFVLEGNGFRKKEKWTAIQNDVIHHIEMHDGRIYVFTKNNGIFIEQNGGLVAWSHMLNQSLKNHSILSAKFVGNNTLAIGTGLQGLYLVNFTDGSYRHLSRENSLKNNAILSLALDKENDLWIGLDNGIAHVEINSPVDVFSDSSGVMGSVYALSPMNGGYLLVTNNGIFTYRDSQLKPVPNSQGQVWDIYGIDNKFIVGHNDGTFVFDGHNLVKENIVNGGWKFFKSDFDGVYFQANYAGIAWYRDINDLSSYKILPRFTKPVRNLEQNKPGEIWAADNYKSLYRITYDKDFNTRKVENVSQANGLKNDFGVKIFRYRNELLFLIDKSWYTYDAISGKLVKDQTFNRTFKDISDIIPVDEESFIVEKSGLLYVITQKGNLFDWKLIPEKYYQGKVIFENTKAYKIGGKIYINLDDGFISYKPSAKTLPPDDMKVEGFYEGELITDNTVIKNSQPVELHVISSYFGYSRPNLYFRRNGSDEYQRIHNGQLVLNNLTGGNQDIGIYVFDGTRYSKLAEYSFYVKFPWYISFWMILIYIIVIAVIFLLYYRWNHLRTNQKLQLQEEELRHQREIVEMELKRENELNVQEYEKHILELELQSKSSQVAGKSLSIAKQSEMIENIEKILDSESNISRLKSDIKKVIKFNAVNKHEWESFESNLSQVHNEFIKNLSKRYPQLTSKDIRLSIYLRMNMSSKEIAPLMNISFRGVELHRYRLRKKLGLAAEESISKFMLEI
ncbi:histidine kinase [Flavobacterium sp. MAH-1]|uniref:Histidine kinase n=1 Tax=Flavobacterium agri TaxID=2743471 RepID=A0A7Y8Y431_9FLAO|nr:two-component regulator propeller domain-containing protein [Flavobacterium agri]NUY82210.1 histidine kinase [Flavobacterium agri]NYA72234.1 histidine kinase [Flavobacterium agri]